jgi:glycosyltransferase involved in cell wall biosynthesis
MAWKPPRVSICVPVRNGQKHLRACLDSILSQTFGNFELLICDNASTDATESIAHDYAARDPRVRYIRHSAPLTPAQNFNRGFELSCGEYFRWHAADDCIAPDHLQRSVEALDRNPSAVLVYPKAKFINDAGRGTSWEDSSIDTDLESPVRRFRRLICANPREHRNFEIFGLARWTSLRETMLHEPFAYSDRVLIAHLSLIGRMVQIPRHLFMARSHAARSSHDSPTTTFAQWLARGPMPPPEWWNPALKGRIVFPEWNLLRQYHLAIKHSELRWYQRIGCYFALTECAVRSVPRLTRDLVLATETIFTRLAAPLRRRAETRIAAGAAKVAG